MSDEPSPGKDLTGRVYLVTGAGAGLGRAVSLAFARAGATVVLLDKEMKALEAVYDEIETAGGPQPAIFAADLEGAQPHEFHKLVETLESELGRLDGLVHAAARLGPLMPLATYPPEDWTAVLRVNLTAPYLLTQACLPLLEHAEDPSVTFVSDPVGAEPEAYWGAFAVSKAGLEGLAQVLARETERGAVRVNTVEPGPLRTSLQLEAFPAGDSAAWRDPAEVAPLFLEIVQPAASGVHGRRFGPGDLPGS